MAACFASTRMTTRTTNAPITNVSPLTRGEPHRPIRVAPLGHAWVRGLIGCSGLAAQQGLVLPERIAASLAVQFEAMFPDERDGRAKPEGRLPELLGRVSKRLGASGRLVIVVDGLDETRAEPGENPLPRFLPRQRARASA